MFIVLRLYTLSIYNIIVISRIFAIRNGFACVKCVSHGNVAVAESIKLFLTIISFSLAQIMIKYLQSLIDEEHFIWTNVRFVVVDFLKTITYFVRIVFGWFFYIWLLLFYYSPTCVSASISHSFISSLRVSFILSSPVRFISTKSYETELFRIKRWSDACATNFK